MREKYQKEKYQDVVVDEKKKIIIPNLFKSIVLQVSTTPKIK
jgi:hypothetical protein